MSSTTKALSLSLVTLLCCTCLFLHFDSCFTNVQITRFTKTDIFSKATLEDRTASSTWVIVKPTWCNNLLKWISRVCQSCLPKSGSTQRQSQTIAENFSCFTSMFKMFVINRIITFDHMEADWTFFPAQKRFNFYPFYPKSLLDLQHLSNKWIHKVMFSVYQKNFVHVKSVESNYFYKL